MPVIEQEQGERYALYNSDCMNVLTEMKGSGIDMSIYSPPFYRTVSIF